MKQRRAYISIFGAGIIALGTLGVLGARYMSDPANMPFCFIEDEADFLESVASYDRTPLVAADGPVRQVAFAINAPFAFERDDILLLSAYAEGREVDYRFYDGPPPADGTIAARLPARNETSAEVYWLNVALIRQGARMTCGWSMEERFALPAPPHPVRWRLDLLSEPIETEDGGSRLTRLTPE